MEQNSVPRIRFTHIQSIAFYQRHHDNSMGKGKSCLTNSAGTIVYLHGSKKMNLDVFLIPNTKTNWRP